MEKPVTALIRRIHLLTIDITIKSLFLCQYFFTLKSSKTRLFSEVSNLQQPIDRVVISLSLAWYPIEKQQITKSSLEYSSKIQIKLDNGMILIGLFYISTAKSVGEVLNYFIHLYSPKNVSRRRKLIFSFFCKVHVAPD